MNTLKTLLLSVLLPFSIANAFAQWTDVSPTLSIDFNDIHCPSSDTCFAVGFNGLNTTRVLKTEDGGQTWFATESGIPSNINSVAVYCVDNNTCFVGGDNVIYKTVDSGNSWYQVTHPGSFGVVSSIDFPSDSIGYIATGGGSAYLKSVDAGETWNWESIFFMNGLGKIFMVNENLGYALGSVFIGGFVIEAAKTTNGGTNWTDISPSYPANTLAPPNAIHCPNDSTCYIVGGGKRIVSTTNGGANWDTIPLDANFTGYFDIDCIGDTCWITGNNIVLQSHDGINWVPDTVGLPALGSIQSIHFPTPYMGYLGFDLSNVIYKKGSGVGVEETIADNLQYLLYPNPFNEHTTLYFQNTDIGLINGAEVSVYNMLGSEVKKVKIYERKTIITRENLKSGIYLYAVHSNNETIARGKLIIE